MTTPVTATATPGGGHDIWTEFAGQRIVLVRVRPVGTLEMGDLNMFVPGWVPDLISALQMAYEIAEGGER